MTKIKLEHIDNLRRGMKSGVKLGSRATPHHLYQYEEVKYERALKNKYLEIIEKERINLLNLWEKVCRVKGWQNLILEKGLNGIGKVSLDYKEIYSGPLKEAKKFIKNQISL